MSTLLFGTLFFTLLFLSYWRRLHLRYAEQKFRYKLFEIRDKLRMFVIEGKVDKDSIGFDYLDYSISKTINESYYITIFRIITLYITHKDKKKYQEVYEGIIENFKFNNHLQEVQNDYHNAVAMYIISQHYISSLILFPFIKLVMGVRKFRKIYSQYMNAIFYLPETSASYRYKEIASLC